MAGLSLSLRIEGADLGVKVSVVCPGYVQTSIYEHMELVGVDRAEATRTPIKGIGTADATRAILKGVLRNEAIIVFPPVFRWAWRACRA